MPSSMTRRHVLAFGASAGAMAMIGVPAAIAAPDEVARELEAFAGGVPLQEGRITLTIAEAVDNGASVPVSIEVDSAMAGDDMVESVILLAEENPRPIIATFHFSALSGAASVSTRVRLAASQTVIAAARMSDGSVHVARRSVEVTVGGCVG